MEYAADASDWRLGHGIRASADMITFYDSRTGQLVTGTFDGTPTPPGAGGGVKCDKGLVFGAS